MSALLKRVLVVDDDPVVGKSFNRVLSQKGYVVVTAQDGREALSKLQDGDYDVVFTDIRMPGMDGLELAEKVKARKAWTPVVIVTGFGSQANEARAKAAGVTAFLHKPLTPEQIEESARLAMEAPVAHAAEVAALDIAPTIAGLHAQVAPGNGGGLKQLALLAAAPFIGLAFVVLAPFAGLAVLGGMALKLIAQRLMTRKTLTVVRNVALFFAAPFIGLVYVVFLPLAGLVTLAWIGLRRRNDKAEVQ
jgi:CheY-like chemotaxis protein